MKKISIIIPVYKVEKYLDKCVESVVAQTYKDLEIILVDDGSPDNCPAMCDEWAKKDSRIKVVHKENGGLSSARNAGLDIATGEYIGFVDSDDYILPDMYERLYNALKMYNADMSICRVKVFNSEGKTSVLPANDFEENCMTPEEFLTNSTYAPNVWSRLYNRYLWEDFRFPVGKLHEDVFVEHKIVLKCKKIACLTESLYCYLKREESITTSQYSYKRLEAVDAFLIKLKDLLELGYYGALVKSVKATVAFFIEGYTKLDLKDEENYKKIKQLKKEIRHFFLPFVLNKSTIKDKIYFSIFCASTKGYIKLLSLVNKIKKH